MNDLERFAATVRFYHKHGANRPGASRERWQAMCDTLRADIGETRYEAARDAYDAEYTAGCESAEARKSDALQDGRP